MRTEYAIIPVLKCVSLYIYMVQECSLRSPALRAWRAHMFVCMALLLYLRSALGLQGASGLHSRPDGAISSRTPPRAHVSSVIVSCRLLLCSGMCLVSLWLSAAGPGPPSCRLRLQGADGAFVPLLLCLQGTGGAVAPLLGCGRDCHVVWFVVQVAAIAFFR